MSESRHRLWVLTVFLSASFIVCALETAMSAPAQRELTLLLKPVKSVVKQDENIGMMVVFVGGTQETTLILPMGADASRMITYSATEIATGRKWTATNRDARSFAADSRTRIPAGGRLERHHDALNFEGPGVVPGTCPPAGTGSLSPTMKETPSVLRTGRPVFSARSRWRSW